MAKKSKVAGISLPMCGNHVVLDRSSGESLIETKWIGSDGEEKGEKTNKKEEEAASKAKRGRKKIREDSEHSRWLPFGHFPKCHKCEV